MTEEDIDRVVEIIDQHDDEDADEAEADYHKEGIAGQFVTLLDGHIIGVSGARMLDDCDRSFQLSWTYLDKQHCNQGYGRQLLGYVLDQLREFKARKLFIYMSDYVDEDGVSIYAAARHLYLSLEFQVELEIADYYDEGESLTVLGLLLEDKEFDSLPIKPESPKLKFNNLIHIAEIESAYSFGWETKRFGKNFTSEDLELGIDAAKQEEASLILISFPSNYENVEQQLMDSGFALIGSLQDYYEEGVDEEHYLYSFNPNYNQKRSQNKNQFGNEQSEIHKLESQ